MIFYSSQEEEVDYSTNDIDETNDRNDVDNRTPDNAVEDDPQDEKLDPDDESSDGESNNIGDSNKSEKFTHRPFGNKQPPQLLKTTKVCTGKPKLTNKKKQPQGSKKPFPKKKKTDGDPNSKTLQTKFVNQVSRYHLLKRVVSKSEIQMPQKLRNQEPNFLLLRLRLTPGKQKMVM